METTDREKLVISLITDDLIHAKLTEGLSSLGLNAENYALNLGGTILNLMGFMGDRSDEALEQYLHLQACAKCIDNSQNNAGFVKLAHYIYQHLQLQQNLPGNIGAETHA